MSSISSGSTGVAAKNLNRSFIGIEQEEKYFLVAQERIALAGTEKDRQPDLFGGAA